MGKVNSLFQDEVEAIGDRYERGEINGDEAERLLREKGIDASEANEIISARTKIEDLKPGA